MIYQNSGAAGDLKTFEVKIDGQDISDAVTSVEVFQDIYTPTWTAKVYMEDTTNLLSSIPILAGKEITIKMETDLGGMVGDGSKEFKMVVYRVADKSFENFAYQKYTVMCADRRYIDNQKKRVRRAFNRQKPEDAAGIIMGQMGAKVTVDNSDEAMSMLIPGWTPFQAIGWLCKVARCKKSADYCFYQVEDDGFAFKSFEKMFADDENKLDVVFKLRPANVRDEDGDFSGDYNTEFQRFEWQHFDAMAAMAAGGYRSKSVSFDVVGLKWDQHVFNYGDDCPEDAKGRNFEDVMQGDDTNVSFTPKHPGMFTNSGSVLDTADDWMGSRKSAMQKMDSERLIVQLPGGVRAWEWIGRNTRVEMPAQNAMEQDSHEEDRQRSGRFVIAAICHQFRKDSYSMNIEFVKKRLDPD